MFFKFQCSKCGKSLKAREDVAGKSTRCPYCKSSISIPMPSGIDLGLPSQPDPLGDADGGFPNLDLGAASAPEKPSSKGKTAAAKPQTGPSPQKKPAAAAPTGGPTMGEAAPIHNSDASSVSLVTSGIIGFVCAVLLFLVLIPFRAPMFTLNGVNVANMFWNSIHINFPTTLLMFWSFAILIMKSRQVSVQKSAMLFDLLPTEISQEITVSSLDKFVAHIYSLPPEARNSILVNRVLRGIEHFRVRKSAAETVTMMESQSAIDASNVAGSYTIVKVFIWAMPILGFIGTVMGVSAAVAGLSGTLENAADVSAVTDSMKGVFSGLGTAFDTTLLALVMSMLVKIPASAMQKSEEGLVTIADEYCNENLLRRLNDGREGGAERGAGGSGADAKVFQRAVEAAMGTHHAELENWLKKLDSIGDKLTARITKGWLEINEKMAEQQEVQLEKIQQNHAAQAEQLQEQLQGMSESAAGIQSVLSDLATQTATLQNDVASSVSGSTESLQAHFAGLEKGLNGLNSVLETLSEKQVVVQQVEAPRRGWFGSWGNSRGKR